MQTVFTLMALALPVISLYGQFLWSAPVFDDVNFLDGTEHAYYRNKLFSFELRWLPYATFEWTRALLGLNLNWYHWGNLLLHLAASITLFFFLRRLFEHALPTTQDSNQGLPPHWLAFFGALLFALHPASVYAVSYLLQRTILMATLFTLLTWGLFLEGLIREKQRWLLASAASYLLAVLSKEHAIMAPAVAVALLVLVGKQPFRSQLRRILPTFVLYGLIGLFVVFQYKSRHILGEAYEPVAADLLSRLGPDFDVRLAYPLSILTQCYLFFKYLCVWMIPSPAWMSVDIYQPFAVHFWSWPHTAGFIAFIAYPIAAFRLLLKKGILGLLGFALLCPWLLFATELSTIRIQESFVLYRSYLWMAGAFAALPFVCQNLSAKQASIVLALTASLMMPLSWLRLTTFSHPLLIWDDAARLVENEDYRPGMERIFFNRGTELIRVRHYAEAIEDMNTVIKLTAGTGNYEGLGYNNRAWAYQEQKQYNLALRDYNKAIELMPENKHSHIGKAEVLEATNDLSGALQEFIKACQFGMPEACQRLKKKEP
ncbi:MAG: tetratricopeptide repeat protein [Methylococcaceae bacterium]|nr:tetratricopeptide repeat protein [Methylococcaceae bacterium]